MSIYYLTHRSIKQIPINRKKVVKIISFVKIPSSFLVKKREIIGDVLNNVHPIPKGRD
tara:strand:+ start:973 stop:1146 length:174 start_codon:yes stop_codon:yes gene_type:complete